MNAIEIEIHNAIKIIQANLAVDNVKDNDDIRHAIEILTVQLQKRIGRRIIKESRING
jgi:hypothetical protein